MRKLVVVVVVVVVVGGGGCDVYTLVVVIVNCNEWCQDHAYEVQDHAYEVLSGVYVLHMYVLTKENVLYLSYK